MKQYAGFIYIATTLDTKSAEIFYVSELIKKAGLPVKTKEKPTSQLHKLLVTIQMEKTPCFAVTAGKLSQQCPSLLNVI